MLAGALFGAGWWCWVDTIVYSKAVKAENFPFTYWLPGFVATLALILMNLVSRDDLASYSDSYGDEGAATRARCWLFFAYVIAFSAVGGSAAILITAVQKDQYIWAGRGTLLQSGLILASALLFWAFRTENSDSSYGLAF
ncbi:hypothetical protein WJX72_012547 [[Myrmecia] bisecta]|uniref:Transmembrane protein 50A n=1 Tax=[Myrmecia] bisecta TaxID=41462 RepID=A0AAW1QGT6_9CHLO